MRWSIERFAVVAILAVLAGCGSDPAEPAKPATQRDSLVTIAQGQSPNVRGLSVGLASITDDGTANLQVAGEGVGTKILRGRAGDRLRAGGYTVELVEVTDSDDGGTVDVRVTPP